MPPEARMRAAAASPTRVSHLRWGVKKALRAGVALSGLLPADGEPRLHVLTYHRFGCVGRDPFRVTPGDFDRQMGLLARNAAPVSLARLLAFLDGHGTLPPNAVLVTIDDGLRSTLTEALPILRYHGVPAVAFISSGLVGARQPGGEDYLDWDELARLAERGVTIGSHAVSHRSLGRMSAAAAREEIESSKRELEQRLGRRVAAFAYPYGTRADYGPALAELLHGAGYACGFTSQHGATRRGAERYALPRVKVEGGEPLWLFRLLVRGGLDAWSLVDRTLWRLQASR